MPQSLHSNFAHIIFSTKNHEPMIHGNLATKLYAYFNGIVDDLGGTAISINGMPDHVHLLIKSSKTISDADFMKQLEIRTRMIGRWGGLGHAVSRSAAPLLVYRASEECTLNSPKFEPLGHSARSCPRLPGHISTLRRRPEARTQPETHPLEAQ